jgi:hypothetical protein
LPEFGCALAHHESAWDPRAEATDPRDLAMGGSRGLFQMTLVSSRGLGFRGSAEGLFYPDVNTEWAIALAKKNKAYLLSKKAELDSYMNLAAAHNCGVGHVVRGTIPRSTREQYVPAVMRLMDLYKDRAAQYRVK